MSSDECAVCKASAASLESRGITLNVINGFACCDRCDHNFCFRCGKEVNELVGDDSVCIPCARKANPDDWPEVPDGPSSTA